VERAGTILAWIVSAVFLLGLVGSAAIAVINMCDGVRLLRTPKRRYAQRPQPEIIAPLEPGAERFLM
jgi:hypothetical protein